MEHVEPSVNKWKKTKKDDFTYKAFGRVYGCLYGFGVGVIVGILLDKVFMCATIGVVLGIIFGGILGSKYKNRKKIAEMNMNEKELFEEENKENRKLQS